MEPCCSVCQTGRSDCLAYRGGWITTLTVDRNEGFPEPESVERCWECFITTPTQTPVVVQATTEDDPLLRALVHATLASAAAVAPDDGAFSRHMGEAERLLYEATP